MKCSNCGTEFREGIFCPECGMKCEETLNNFDRDVKKEEEEATRLAKEREEKSPYCEAAIDTNPNKQENARGTNSDGGQERKKDITVPYIDREKNNQGIISLICGILGLIFNCIGLGVIPGIVGVIFGIKGIKKQTHAKKAALTGLVLSVIVIIFNIITIIIMVIALASDGVSDAVNDSADNVYQVEENTQETRGDIAQSGRDEAGTENEELSKQSEQVDAELNPIAAVKGGYFEGYYGTYVSFTIGDVLETAWPGGEWKSFTREVEESEKQVVQYIVEEDGDIMYEVQFLVEKVMSESDMLTQETKITVTYVNDDGAVYGSKYRPVFDVRNGLEKIFDQYYMDNSNIEDLDISKYVGKDIEALFDDYKGFIGYTDWRNNEGNYHDFDRTVEIDTTDGIITSAFYKTDEGNYCEVGYGYSDADDSEYEADGQYILLYSDREYLSEDDLEGLSAQELSYARNEIYARHGYVFTSEELNEYFEQQDWYEADLSFDGVLSDVERNNAEFILIYQEENGLTYEVQ